MAAALRGSLAGSPVHEANCAWDCALDAAPVMVCGPAQVPKLEARSPSAEVSSVSIGREERELPRRIDIKDKRAATRL